MPCSVTAHACDLLFPLYIPAAHGCTLAREICSQLGSFRTKLPLNRQRYHNYNTKQYPSFNITQMMAVLTYLTTTGIRYISHRLKNYYMLGLSNGHYLKTQCWMTQPNIYIYYIIYKYFFIFLFIYFFIYFTIYLFIYTCNIYIYMKIHTCYGLCNIHLLKIHICMYKLRNG